MDLPKAVSKGEEGRLRVYRLAPPPYLAGLSTGAAQRRLRESYFVASSTQAAQQLKKMQAEMPV